MMIVKDMDVIADAKLVLARVERAQEPKKQRIIGFDLYYELILSNGYLPGNTATFPNRVKTAELYEDMLERVPDLRFTALRALGIYFAQDRFAELGVAPWRHMTGNGWAFSRLVTLRRDWELRQGGWQWPNGLMDWVRNPTSCADLATRSRL
jgi:hypothetical protein